MPAWPNSIPADLRLILDGTLSQRGVNAAQVWGDLREWLIKHQVEAPQEPLHEEPNHGG